MGNFKLNIYIKIEFLLNRVQSNFAKNQEYIKYE